MTHDALFVDFLVLGISHIERRLGVVPRAVPAAKTPKLSTINAVRIIYIVSPPSMILTRKNIQGSAAGPPVF
jgi:hypothetical protein